MPLVDAQVSSCRVHKQEAVLHFNLAKPRQVGSYDQLQIWQPGKQFKTACSSQAN